MLRTLIDKDIIAARVRELGARIADDYRGETLVVIAILKGSFVFVADLVRAIDAPLRVEMLGVSNRETPLRAGAAQHQLRGSVVPGPTPEAVGGRRGLRFLRRRSLGVVDETLAQEKASVRPQPQRRLDLRAVAAREFAGVDAGDAALHRRSRLALLLRATVAAGR